MSTFFRKRPPYQARHEHNTEIDEDLPIIGPASDSDDDFPLLEPEMGTEVDADDDFPIVGPAAEDEPAEALALADFAEIPIVEATETKPSRQFTPSTKLNLPEAPAWVQEQANKRSTHDSNDLSNHIPVQLENAIQVIISNEMEAAEKRIKQKILDELNAFLKNSSF